MRFAHVCRELSFVQVLVAGVNAMVGVGSRGDAGCEKQRCKFLHNELMVGLNKTAETSEAVCVEKM